MKKILISLLFISLSVSVAATENVSDVVITDVETHEVSTPRYSGDDGDDTLYVKGMPLRQSGRKKWFRISVEYETEPEWTDHLTLEFYVIMPGDEDVLFKGIINYVDIPEGDDHLAEMYMHFNSYARYHDRGKFKTAVVAKIGGKILSVSEPNSVDDPWWEDTQLHPCGLLNRLDTPFRIVNVDSYQAQDFCSW